MSTRIYLVGSDTGCGKTSVAAAILRCARGHGLKAIPFKPAASGGDDPEVLAAAAALLPGMIPWICPQRFAAPLAPGIAEAPERFLGGPVDERLGDQTLAAAAAALDELEAELRPDLTVIEGAGGWWVPMPGGTWQPDWLGALGATPVIVGRLGLGTINHTLLTIDAARGAGHRPPGFFLSRTTTTHDPSELHNPSVIATAADIPCLGVLSYGHNGRGWLSEEIFARLGARPRPGRMTRL
ncbi:MAG: dethiobiotin synthase [Nannocystis sp.]|nr:dethiobiotin synthase [Nannocystis sp.]